MRGTEYERAGGPGPAWARATHLGVTGFGQSSDLPAAYALHGIDVDVIVSASLDVIG